MYQFFLNEFEISVYSYKKKVIQSSVLYSKIMSSEFKHKSNSQLAKSEYVDTFIAFISEACGRMKATA